MKNNSWFRLPSILLFLALIVSISFTGLVTTSSKVSAAATNCPNDYSRSNITGQCYPNGPAACNPTTQYWQPPNGANGNGQCLDKASNPHSQADCPTNYTYENLGGGGQCYPNGPSACTSSQYWQPPNGANGNGQCLDKASNPHSQADCPSGTTYENLGDGGQCINNSQVSNSTSQPQLSCDTEITDPLTWIL